VTRYRFDGWQRNVGGLGGNVANIRAYTPWVYPLGTGDRGTFVWTMLANGGYFAQVGWVEYPYELRYTFVEIYDQTGDHFLEFAPEAIDSNSSYGTLYLNRPGQFSFNINGNLIYWFNANFTPTRALTYGETHDLGSQMPGKVSDRTVIDYNFVWIGQPGTSNGSWRDINESINGQSQASAGSLANPPATFYNFGTNTPYDPRHHIDIWDPDCP
jgi:hypothetical protein